MTRLTPQLTRIVATGELADWPTGAPGSQGHTAPEVITMRADRATPYSPPRTVPIVTHINNPSITPFLPTWRSTDDDIWIA